MAPILSQPPGRGLDGRQPWRVAGRPVMHKVRAREGMPHRVGQILESASIEFITY